MSVGTACGALVYLFIIGIDECLKTSIHNPWQYTCLLYNILVPLVLKSCADVIESQGLVDGIYRLSGITSNIQKLRYTTVGTLHLLTSHSGIVSWSEGNLMQHIISHRPLLYVINICFKQQSCEWKGRCLWKFAGIILA